MEREEIYRHLRSQITLMTLEPGTYLSENTLAEELGVSRSPIRDALSHLEDDGCVVVYPQRGTQVSLISLDRIRQCMFARAVLDREIFSELCERRLTKNEYNLLQDSLHRQRTYYETKQDEALLQEDIYMHRLFYQFCGREFAWDTFSQIDCDKLRVAYLQINSYGQMATMMPVDSWENAIVEHRMMIDAVHKGDNEAIYMLNNRHIEQFIWSAEYFNRIFPHYFLQSEA